MSLSFSRFDFPSSLLLGTATVAAIVISHPAAMAAKSPQEIAKIAIPMTVQVNPPEGVKDGGSGVIIKRQGDTYTVLTCNHVAKMRSPLTIRTHDGKSYSVTSEQRLQKSNNDPDLALLTFSSSAEYPVATVAKAEATVGAEIFVFGYPALSDKFGADRDFEFSPGYVTSRRSNAPEGYTLRYNAVTKGGMSGGPVFDVDGRVVGIHGNGDGEKIAVKEGFKSSALTVVMKTGFNAAIPINTFLALRSQIGQDAADIAVDNTPSTDQPAQRLRNPKSASDFLAKGVVAREQGNKSQAIDAYTQAISRNPNYADAYYQRGNARYDQGDKQGALTDYTQAIKFNPEYANAYYQRGVIRFNNGDKQGALGDFDQYISRSPDDIQGYYTRGVIRRALGDVQGTFADFDSVVRLDPNNAKAYYNRGLARSGLRDKEGTLADFNQAISLDPSWTVAYNTRAMLRRRMGDREGSIADFSEIIRLAPKNAVAYFNRGLVRRDLGDQQGAITDLHSAADLFQEQGDTSNYQKALEKIQNIQATPSTAATEQPESAVDSSQPTPDATETEQPESAVDSSQPAPDATETEQPESAVDSAW